MTNITDGRASPLFKILGYKNLHLFTLPLYFKINCFSNCLIPSKLWEASHQMFLFPLIIIISKPYKAHVSTKALSIHVYTKK